MSVSSDIACISLPISISASLLCNEIVEKRGLALDFVDRCRAAGKNICGPKSRRAAALAPQSGLVYGFQDHGDTLSSANAHGNQAVAQLLSAEIISACKG